MKMKNLIGIMAIAILTLLCIGGVCATEDGDNLSIDNNDSQIEYSDDFNEINGNSSGETGFADGNASTTTDQNTTQQNAPKSEKINPTVFCSQEFIHKKSKTFKVKVYSYNDNSKLVYHKNLKLTVKVKIGKKTKTYNVKTNNKGEAKILNVKNLKVGTYKVTVTTPDKRFKIKETGHIFIYGKAKKKTTIKMKKNKYGIEATKKLNKRDILWTFYEPRDAQFKKGVYAKTYDVKNPLDGFPHSMIYKAKFYFKNKKTGKIISKTAKLKADKFYGWKDIKVKPIKGYKPIETKVWYLTR